jgi:hypothetical protein
VSGGCEQPLLDAMQCLPDMASRPANGGLFASGHIYLGGHPHPLRSLPTRAYEAAAEYTFRCRGNEVEGQERISVRLRKLFAGQGHAPCHERARQIDAVAPQLCEHGGWIPLRRVPRGL